MAKKKYLKDENGITRALSTNELRLEKPLGNENYDVNVFNNNMDKIDVAIKNVKNDLSNIDLTAERVEYSKNECSNVDGALDKLFQSDSEIKTSIQEANTNITNIQNELSTNKNNIGTLSSLQTTNKNNLVSAINEVFQNANNGKQIIATAVGSPITSSDTFTSIGTKIDTLTQTFKDNLTAKGVAPSSSDKLSSLINKVKDIKTETHNFPSWAKFDKNYWIKGVTKSPRIMQYSCSFNYNNKIYVLGGIDESALNNVYDTISNTWTTKANYPGSRGIFEATATLDGDIAYIIGNAASGYEKYVYAYNVVSDTWTQKSNCINMKRAHTACLKDNNIYCLSGIFGSSTTRAMESYNTISDTWSSKRSFDYGWKYHIAEICGNNMYVLGGMDESDRGSDKVFYYNISNDRWERYLWTMPYSISRATSVVIKDRIYITSGVYIDPFNSNKLDSSLVWEFNTTTNKLKIVSSIPIPRSNHVSEVVGDKIYTIGGFVYKAGLVDNGNITEIEVYIP